MKNVVVCGGAGFVGRHLVNRLLDTPGVERIVVADRDEERLKAFSASPSHVWISPSELQNDTGSLFSGCDTVFHLASNADIAKAVEDPDIDFRDGTLVTRNILEGMRKYGAKQIVYLSGSGVYGDVPGVAFTEDFGPCIPNSPYGASKLASEALIAAYSSMFGIEALVLRPANIVGPSQTHGVCYDFVRALKQHPDYLQILGNGGQRKSYIHINDIVDAIFFLIGPRYGKTRHEIFNIASDDEISVNRIALFAILACCHNKKVPFVTWGEGPRGWAGDIPNVKLDTSELKIRGWRPIMASSEAVRSALRSLYEA